MVGKLVSVHLHPVVVRTYPARFSNALLSFERFACCFSETQVPFERFAPCFSNTRTFFRAVRGSFLKHFSLLRVAARPHDGVMRPRGPEAARGQVARATRLAGREAARSGRQAARLRARGLAGGREVQGSGVEVVRPRGREAGRLRG